MKESSFNTVLVLSVVAVILTIVVVAAEFAERHEEALAGDGGVGCAEAREGFDAAIARVRDLPDSRVGYYDAVEALAWRAAVEEYCGRERRYRP